VYYYIIVISFISFNNTIAFNINNCQNNIQITVDKKKQIILPESNTFNIGRILFYKYSIILLRSSDRYMLYVYIVEKESFVKTYLLFCDKEVKSIIIVFDLYCINSLIFWFTYIYHKSIIYF